MRVPSLLTHSLLMAAFLLTFRLDGATDTPSVGLLGDGTGFYPDTRPVTAWSENRYEQRKEGRLTWDEPVGDARKNIVWKVSLPMWGNNQPLVLDGKVYLLHEMPYWDDSAMGPSLVCLDAQNGKTLWSNEVHHLDLIPAGERAKVVALWLEERRWVAAKWRLAWRMHLAQPGDAKEIAAIWQEAVALGVTSTGDKSFGTKLQDAQMGDTGRFWGGQPDARKERMQILDQHHLWQPAWGELSHNTPGRWMGETFATPVSDGKRLYIRTARHLLLCVDLDSKVMWKTLYSDKKGYCDFAPSPILVDDTLIVYSSAGRGDDGVLCRGFDPANGKLRWKLDGRTSTYALGTPTPVTLASGKRVVFLPSGHVIDPTSGKALGTVPCHLASGDNPVAHGDVVFMRNSQSGGGYGGDEKGVPKGVQAVRLVADGAAVKAEVLWRSGDGYGSGLVCTGNLLFAAAGNGVQALDPATGKVLGSGRGGGRSWNLLVAGGNVYSGDSSRGKIVVFTADKNLSQVSENQIGQPKKIPSDMWHYRNEKSNWGVAGDPFPMTASGNRLFVRTWYDVYCIGN